VADAVTAIDRIDLQDVFEVAQLAGGSPNTQSFIVLINRIPAES
jgi:hypothetical protein